MITTALFAQFLQMQKSQLIDLQEHLECYCNVLPVFGFNGANCQIKTMKSYLIPIPINGQDIEPVVIGKANRYFSSKFGHNHILDIMNFLLGAENHHSFLKAYKTSKTKLFFPLQMFRSQCQMQNTDFTTCDAFSIKLRVCYPLEAEYTE